MTMNTNPNQIRVSRTRGQQKLVEAPTLTMPIQGGLTTEESVTLSPEAQSSLDMSRSADQGLSNLKGTGKALGNLKDGAKDLAEFQGMDSRLKELRRSLGKTGATLGSVAKKLDPKPLKNQFNGAQIMLGAKQIFNGEYADGIENVSEAGMSLAKEGVDGIKKFGDKVPGGLKKGAKMVGKVVGRAPAAVLDGANDINKFSQREAKTDESWFSANKQAISGGLKIAGGIAVGAAIALSGPIGWGVAAAGSASIGAGTAVEYSQELSKGASKVGSYVSDFFSGNGANSAVTSPTPPAARTAVSG